MNIANGINQLAPFVFAGLGAFAVYLILVALSEKKKTSGSISNERAIRVSDTCRERLRGRTP